MVCEFSAETSSKTACHASANKSFFRSSSLLLSPKKATKISRRQPVQVMRGGHLEVLAI
jgi:hypothetical protein